MQQNEKRRAGQKQKVEGDQVKIMYYRNCIINIPTLNKLFSFIITWYVIVCKAVLIVAFHFNVVVCTYFDGTKIKCIPELLTTTAIYYIILRLYYFIIVTPTQKQALQNINKYVMHFDTVVRITATRARNAILL